MNGQYYRSYDLANILHLVETVVLNRTKNIFCDPQDCLQYSIFPRI